MIVPSSVSEGAQALASDLRAHADPVAFAHRAGIAPDPWQAGVLRSRANRMLLNCSRQSGKSTTTALLALHTGSYQPGALVLLLSPSLRQSAELFRKVAGLHGGSGASVPPKAESALRLELGNGSRIISLPGTEATVRGFSGVDLLVIDEASRVDDALYFSVRPMLATSNGRLVALSTPYGRRGWWSDAWHGASEWERVRVTAQDCPRISPEFLAEERESIGEWWFRQEYECAFMDGETQAFRSEDILMAQAGEEVEQWSL